MFVRRSTTLLLLLAGACGNTGSIVAASSSSVMLAAGYEHSCALAAGGGAVCWGQNRFGQLGDGATADRGWPTSVWSLAGAISLAAGGYHSCALLFSGGVRCWGSGAGGRLGDGLGVPSAIPVVVSAFERSGARTLTAGGSHTCALSTGGRVWCWGQNTFGQLGDTTFVDRARPARVVGIEDVVGVAAGGDQTCALAHEVVFCWGRNFAGQIGDGALDDRASATRVIGLPEGDPPIEVSASGSVSCARLRSGDVYCWGNNFLGQLGDGSDALVRAAPSRVSLTRPAVRLVGGGGDHTCALDAQGAAWCWGSNDFGQLGDGAFGNRLARRTPVVASGTRGARVVELSLGGCHTCARFDDGKTKCWGRNHHGQLGDGTLVDRPTPVMVARP